MIALLGGCLVNDPQITSALAASLATLKRHQTRAGCIPNHVDTETGKPNFRAYADAGLWYVIGTSILQPDLPSVRRVLSWYACQDVDQTGLISIQEASDWQDSFCTRGKGLYVNCLYVIALRKGAAMAAAAGARHEADRYRERADVVRNAINRYLWYRGDGEMVRHVSHSFSTDNLHADSLGRQRWIPRKRILVDQHYYLPYVSFREVGEWFDCLGNFLAVLSGVADDDQQQQILDFVQHHGLAVHPASAIYPAVSPGDPDWRDYYRALNLPNRYHNGGIWPFIGGFYVAALVKAGRYGEAESALGRLARLNLHGCFNEWHDGENAAPMGVQEQAWSAGMYLYAMECVATGRVPFL